MEAHIIFVGKREISIIYAHMNLAPQKIAQRDLALYAFVAYITPSCAKRSRSSGAFGSV